MHAGINRYNPTRCVRIIVVVAVLLLAMLPQALAAGPAELNASPQTSGSTTHVVQAGETLAIIAARYGVTVQAIVSANNIANANIIYVGQRLQIPSTGQQQPGAAQPAPAQPGGCAQTHTVVAGESLSGLAVRYGVTIQSLASANNTTVTSFVYIGQRLCIPGAGSGGGTTGGGGGTPTRSGGVWYEVQIGDTLSRIAFNHGVTVNAIVQANNLPNPNTVFWGTRIWIPQAGSTAPAPEAQQPAPAPTPAPVTGDPFAVVTTSGRLNVRGGPGTEYPVVSTIASGTRVRIVGIGPNDEWYKVEVAGVSGDAWIYQGLTRTEGSVEGVKRYAESEVPPRPEAPAPQPQQPAQPPPTRLPGIGFGFGVQAHMIHNGQEGIVMDKTRELGFGWVKQQIEWKVFESNQGQYGFGDIWPLVNAANSRGISLLFSVVNAPSWSRESGFDGSVGGPPADPGTFAAFLGRLAGEYCGSSVKAIEVWNEQNLHYEWGNRPINPSEYMALLRPSYGAIKSACPSMYVISGALTPAGDNGSLAMDDFRYFEAMLQQGLANYVDGFGAHPSGYNVPPDTVWQNACAEIQKTGNQNFNGACDNPHHSWSFRSTMEGYRNLALRYGAGHIPIWPTEFGWAAGGAFDPRYGYANDNDFDEQARWTVRAFEMMRNWGWVGPAFLWNLNFRVVADGTEKAQWGIVRNDWSPLPVYHALRNMPK